MTYTAHKCQHGSIYVVNNDTVIGPIMDAGLTDQKVTEYFLLDSWPVIRGPARTDPCIGRVIVEHLNCTDHGGPEASARKLAAVKSYLNNCAGPPDDPSGGYVSVRQLLYVIAAS
jgi:hypothetical protein